MQPLRPQLQIPPQRTLGITLGSCHQRLHRRASLSKALVLLPIPGECQSSLPALLHRAGAIRRPTQVMLPLVSKLLLAETTQTLGSQSPGRILGLRSPGVTRGKPRAGVIRLPKPWKVPELQSPGRIPGRKTLRILGRRSRGTTHGRRNPGPLLLRTLSPRFLTTLIWRCRVDITTMTCYAWTE